MAATREPVLIAFGAALRLLRERRSLSQEALAERIGVQRTYLTEVERGRRNVTLVTVGRLAEGVGVGIGELMTLAERELQRPGG